MNGCIPFVLCPCSHIYLKSQPYGALFAGCVAGTVATLGYQVSHLLLGGCLDILGNQVHDRYQVSQIQVIR